jgi:tetratricopeptide (TPR) repeat protein
MLCLFCFVLTDTAYGNLGNILSAKGQYEEAEACYRKALLYRPNMADVHYNL